jgi:hypothetical protein
MPNEMAVGASQRENAASWYRKFHTNDYFTLLHLPFASTLISYAIIGSAMAPSISAARLAVALVAVFFAHQGSHYLDEIRGHPWNTKISNRTLYALGFIFLAIGIAAGVYLLITVSFMLILFFIPMVFFPIAYSMELWRGLFHRPLSFGISSALVCLGSYFLQSLSISLSSLLMSLAICIQSVYIIILYEATKADSTKFLSWNTLKGIIILWIFIAASLLLLRTPW